MHAQLQNNRESEAKLEARLGDGIAHHRVFLPAGSRASIATEGQHHHLRCIRTPRIYFADVQMQFLRPTNDDRMGKYGHHRQNLRQRHHFLQQQDGLH